MKKRSIYIILIALIVISFIFGTNKSSHILPNTYYQVYLDGNLIGTIKSKDKLEKYINNKGILIKNQVLDYQKQIDIINNFETIINNNYFSDDISAKVNEFNSYKYYITTLRTNVDEEGNILDSDFFESIDESYLNDTNIKIKKNVITNYSDVIEKLNNKIRNLLEYICNNIDETYLNEIDGYYLNEFVNNKYYEIDYSKIIYMLKYVDEYEIYSYVNNVYKPLGITIQKINTYDKEYMSEEEMYEKIIELKPCTIEGYVFRIKRDDTREIDNNVLFGSISNTPYRKVYSYVSNDIIIYTIGKELFDQAVETFAEVFVGKEDYEKYKNNTQDEIIDTGKIINNIDIEQDITVKKTNISVKEKIFTNADDLSSYLLYGDNVNVTTAVASATDTISSFAYKNQISVEEFFLFNREFTSIDNMFYDGQVITIAKLNPQISLVVEEYNVYDKEVKYNIIEKYNSNLTKGSRVVTQEGQNGIDRVGQNVVKVNGSITYVEPVSQETIVGSTSEIVEIGTKIIPNVGSIGSWGWPTNPGYTFSSYFGYRPSVFGEGDFHSGLDIAGTGIGSPVYAANNGTVIIKTTTYSYGNYIMIDHNNGYFTLYAHMNGFAPDISVGSTVSRGQIIGYVGQTGWATGPHLHYEIRTCQSYSCCVDPLSYY